MITQEHEYDQDLFSVLRACEIDAEPVSTNWLIEDLWTASAVGWVAGSPKVWKSWTALDMAVSVASGTPCLGRFAVDERGTALVYLAEDSLASVRERIEALTHQRGLELQDLDLHVITTPSMRLDLGRDQVRLQKTARALSPRILILDPLVRIHRSDENSSAEVSALLAYLRALQRELDLAIVVVHHVRKNGATSQTAGHGLRGSSDLHAWSDSALYLKRKGDCVVVTVEHRSAPAPSAITFRLTTGDGPPRLEIVDLPAGEREDREPLEETLLALLADSAPLTRTAIRERLSVRNERLGRELDRLAEHGVVERTPLGWKLRESSAADRSVFPSMGLSGNGTVQDPPDVDDDGLHDRSNDCDDINAHEEAARF